MRKILCITLTVLFVSCQHKNISTDKKIVTVSIAPFKYFVEAIAGNDFKVNVIVPQGADPHIYEPLPKQIRDMDLSKGYISNGYLDFEVAWLNRFQGENHEIKILILGDEIEMLIQKHAEKWSNGLSSDPHFWVSPKCAKIIAKSIKIFLLELDPSKEDEYNIGYDSLVSKINMLDEKADSLFASVQRRSFMTFHPNLGYIARDYSLNEISVEYEGVEPSPAKIFDLIRISKEKKINTVFVRRESDLRQAKVFAEEIKAEIKVIDPLSEDWYESTSSIIDAVYESLTENSK